MVLQRTLTTYVARGTTCVAGRRYLRKRNILSSFQNIKHGHWQFVMHIPADMTAEYARVILQRTFSNVYHELPKYEEQEIEAGGVIQSMGDTVSTRDGKVEPNMVLLPIGKSVDDGSSHTLPDVCHKRIAHDIRAIATHVRPEPTVLHGPISMFHSGAIVELRFNSPEEAQDFFNRTVVRADPNH